MGRYKNHPASGTLRLRECSKSTFQGTQTFNDDYLSEMVNMTHDHADTKCVTKSSTDEIPLGAFVPSYVYRRAVIGAVERTGEGYRLTPNGHFPELKSLASRVFPSLTALHSTIDSMLSNERLAELRNRETSWMSADEEIKAYFEEKFEEYTWTGDHYDENRSLEELAMILQQTLRQAVATDALPGPPEDYRVTTWVPSRKSMLNNNRKLIIWSHRVAVEKGFREHLIEYAQQVMRPLNKSTAMQEDDWANPRPVLAFSIEAFMPTVMPLAEHKQLEAQGWTHQQIERERLGRYLKALGLHQEV